MEQKHWKLIAIIFISLFILETIIFAYVWNAGTEQIDDENTCSINICQNNGYDAYFYDYWEKICYCYKEHEIVYQEYLD